MLRILSKEPVVNSRGNYVFEGHKRPEYYMIEVARDVLGGMTGADPLARLREMRPVIQNAACRRDDIGENGFPIMRGSPPHPVHCIAIIQEDIDAVMG